ncbi:MAG: hypothetical protein V4542_05815 [Pseudomonadota bacterium]
MIQFPITINENGDVTKFWSIAEAESWLEVVDVTNNEYVATDAGNQPLLLTVADEIRPVFFGLFKMRHSVVKVLEQPLSASSGHSRMIKSDQLQELRALVAAIIGNSISFDEASQALLRFNGTATSKLVHHLQHMVADCDIRSKDVAYRTFQNESAEKLLGELEAS